MDFDIKYKSAYEGKSGSGCLTLIILVILAISLIVIAQYLSR